MADEGCPAQISIDPMAELVAEQCDPLLWLQD